MQRLFLKFFLPLVLTLAGIVYFYTKPPSILWIDSGTMIAAAKSFGIPNPPGFPFYVLLSHFFTVIPNISALLGLEIFTILFSILLLAFVYKIILLILNNNFYFFGESKVEEKEPTVLNKIASGFGTLSLAFSYQYWSQSQNTEAFIFSYFFLTAFAYLLLRWSLRYKTFIEKHQPSATYQKYVFLILLLLAFLYGLAAGTNPTVTSFIPAVLFVMFLNRKFLNEKRLALLFSAFVLTFGLVYAYLPIRASSYPFMNWGNPQTLPLFIGQLRGAGLNIYEPETNSINGFTGSPLIFIQSISYYLYSSLFQFTPILFPFIIYGIYTVFKANRKLFYFLILAPLVNAFYGGLYFSGNQESWFIISWIFMSIFLGVGFWQFAKKGRNPYKKSIQLLPLSLLPLLVFFVPLNRSNDYYSQDYGLNLYNSVGKNAIVIGTGDFFNSLTNYYKVGDTYRTDVIPVTANMFYVNRWYRDNLRNSTNLVVSDKIENIIKYKSYGEYNEAMNQFISDNIDKRPIYVTPLTLRASVLAGTNAGQLQLDGRFKFIPRGLVLQVIKTIEDGVPEEKDYSFKFKSSLKKSPIYFERNYKSGYQNLLNEYVYAYEALGDWYLDQGYKDKALQSYEQAESYTKGNAELLARFGEFFDKQKNYNASYQYFQKAAIFSGSNPSIRFKLGVALANVGKTEAAKQEFQVVKQLVLADDPFAKESDKYLDKLSGPILLDPKLLTETLAWKEVKDIQNNLYIRVPEQFNKQKVDLVSKEASISAILLSNNAPGKFNLNVEILGHKLQADEELDSYLKDNPLKMEGNLLDSQNLNYQGYEAKLQIFATQNGGSEQRQVLKKGDFVWLFKVYPASSNSMSIFYQILNTFRPFDEMNKNVK